MPVRRLAAATAANPSLLPDPASPALRLVEGERCRAARVWLRGFQPLRLPPPPIPPLRLPPPPPPLRLPALRLGLARPAKLVLEVEP